MKYNSKQYQVVVENLYPKETKIFGSYHGQYGGTQKVVERDYYGEYVTTTKQSNIRVEEAKEELYGTLSSKERRIVKAVKRWLKEVKEQSRYINIEHISFEDICGKAIETLKNVKYEMSDKKIREILDKIFKDTFGYALS